MTEACTVSLLLTEIFLAKPMGNKEVFASSHLQFMQECQKSQSLHKVPRQE